MCTRQRQFIWTNITTAMIVFIFQIFSMIALSQNNSNANRHKINDSITKINPQTSIDNRRGENILVLHNTSGLPETSVTINMEIINEDLFVGFQFDLSLDDGFQFIPGSEMLNPERIIDHQLNAGMLPGTNLLRVLSYSFTNSFYVGNSGIIASFSLYTPSISGVYTLVPIEPIIGNILTINILTQAIHSTVTVVPSPLIPEQLSLENIFFPSGSDTCIAAQETIITSAFIIQNGAIVRLMAGENIRLLPESQIESGAIFHAIITNDFNVCENYNNMLTREDELNAQRKTLVQVPEKENSLVIYPNPTSGLLTLEFPEKIHAPGTNIILSDVTGEFVLLMPLAGQNKITVNLSSVSNGIYFIKVISHNSIRIHKIIKY